MFNEIAAGFQSGNGYIVMMIVLGFLATMLIFERLIMLLFVYHIDFKSFVLNLKKMIVADDLSRAINFCKGVSNTSLPYIARKALEAADTDPTTVRGAIEEETIAFLPRIEARVGILMIIATLILLLGVLGAIDALWSTFHAVSVLDTAKKQASLGQEIASALTPSALGLMVCMVILSGQQIIKSLASRLIDQTHLGVTMLHNLLVPAEVMSGGFMPVAVASGGQVQASNDSPSEEAPAPAPAQGSNDANFEDAAVEDIRDEEEII